MLLLRKKRVSKIKFLINIVMVDGDLKNIQGGCQPPTSSQCNKIKLKIVISMILAKFIMGYFFDLGLN